MQRASFPLLKGLVLLNCTGSPLPETARFSLDCPRLTGLAYLHAPVFFFPLAALEDLDLNRPSPELSLQTLCALAEAAPRLRTLKINWTKPAPRSEGNAAHFPRLGTLAIKDCHYPETILDCIDAPALSTLSLDECLLSRPPASPSEQRTIRSFPAVHTLRLRQVCVQRLGPGYADPLPVFQYTPAIKVLELGRWCQLHMTAVVTHFAWMKPIPFRSLHTLQVSGPANYVFVHLSKILTQRMQGELPLVELSRAGRRL
ncbi:hypothetical protein PsYK624_025970 [Phanerochaete sordida]|uniref:F-box domain-containing protein n=1 Tax=Phanerochaete sordida TaxID=48140 RepID=A0A9P3LA85_9APHY|nr:hypothetical protein PsYK624_025970 [Phanerochaete sordida]